MPVNGNYQYPKRPRWEPTKEQTLAYLSKTFKLVEGETELYNGTHIMTLEKMSLSLNEITVSRKFLDIDTERIMNVDDICTSLNWEDVVSIKIIGDRNKGMQTYSSDNLGLIDVEFSSNINCNGNFRKIYSLYVLKTKEESFKKALERLVEIAKEENKNPFEN